MAPNADEFPHPHPPDALPQHPGGADPYGLDSLTDLVNGHMGQNNALIELWDQVVISLYVGLAAVAYFELQPLLRVLFQTVRSSNQSHRAAPPANEVQETQDAADSS